MRRKGEQTEVCELDICRFSHILAKFAALFVWEASAEMRAYVSARRGEASDAGAEELYVCMCTQRPCIAREEARVSMHVFQRGNE